ncbi:thioredoxin TrxC [Chitinimonas sp.]|uniref:thioredoxin TrxC n=1 Tax=Chitinimonas sp. TaxID=1934313 RepID=UPI0035B402FA
MQLNCPHCGTANRFPDQRLSDGPSCGGCKRPLLAGTPLEVDDAQLPLFLANSREPVLVDFWAAWCGPCQVMAPQFAAAASQRPGVHFVKVDSDAAPVASRHFAIRSIPTLILFRQGQEVARLSGAMQASQLLAWLDGQLGS